MKKNINSGALPCNTVAKDQADYLCQNYITVIQPIKDNKVIVCGTNGLVPVCYTCTYADTANTLSCPAAGDGAAEEDKQCFKNGVGAAGCYYIEDAGLVAFEPLQETAWLYMDDATLGEVIYAGANEEQNKDSVISRATIDGDGKINLASVVKTDKDDPDWLNNAQFVGDPIEYGDHIYFFFRETATEYINAGKIVYSRVGRVCKNDTGGGAGTMLDGLWTTFQKARLNCSTQGVFPFYFNELQDIHPATQDENVIYATFSTAETGATGSAVCVFRLDEIQQLFDNGRFKRSRKHCGIVVTN
ncbi:semaphorin-2A-like isoform X2 [Amphiura filiformis]|uniref:semaphorin-2A-like isoform X2 n=1 Tax=Amphiura filiformis TaxID=82378 RepID=UPI003B21FC49